MSIVEELEELKPIIKEKWLNFYEENLSLFKNINLHNEKPYRPHGSVIVPIILLLEPRLKNHILLFSMANSDPEKIVELLGLDFHIENTINNTKKERNEQKIAELSDNQSELTSNSPLDDFRQLNK